VDRVRVVAPPAGSARLTVITDAPDFARSLLGSEVESGHYTPSSTGATTANEESEDVARLATTFFDGSAVMFDSAAHDAVWRYLVVSGFSAGSQYDRLIGLARQRAAAPDGVACVARTGIGFQGFKGRSWVASPGNVHLSVHFAPARPIERFETVFMALAAVSVIETIDSIPGLSGRAGVKWVNDVVIEGSKVAGVLAYSQTRGDVVTSVVLGIGLNVETRPTVTPTPFVPRAAALRDYVAGAPAVEASSVLRLLLSALARNYRILLREGYRPLMDRYRERSVVIGREVLISSDDPDEVPRIFAAGRVAAISDGMELHLFGGEHPVNRGRLILPPPAATPTPDDRHSVYTHLDIAS
jgi:biotin-[acetyl-CoA-carboxylase] ligase BirA-like protein